MPSQLTQFQLKPREVFWGQWQFSEEEEVYNNTHRWLNGVKGKWSFLISVKNRRTRQWILGEEGRTMKSWWRLVEIIISRLRQARVQDTVPSEAHKKKKKKKTRQDSVNVLQVFVGQFSRTWSSWFPMQTVL